jgi:hypothetical protein
MNVALSQKSQYSLNDKIFLETAWFRPLAKGWKTPPIL